MKDYQPLYLSDGEDWLLHWAYPDEENWDVVVGSAPIVKFATLAGERFLAQMISVDGGEPVMFVDSPVARRPGVVFCQRRDAHRDESEDVCAVLYWKAAGLSGEDGWTPELLELLRRDAGDLYRIYQPTCP